MLTYLLFYFLFFTTLHAKDSCISYLSPKPMVPIMTNVKAYKYYREQAEYYFHLNLEELKKLRISPQIRELRVLTNYNIAAKMNDPKSNFRLFQLLMTLGKDKKKTFNTAKIFLATAASLDNHEAIFTTAKHYCESTEEKIFILDLLLTSEKLKENTFKDIEKYASSINLPLKNIEIGRNQARINKKKKLQSKKNISVHSSFNMHDVD